MATVVQQQRQQATEKGGSLLLAGASVEDRLRAAVQYKNVRIREFFKDFDPLRKGVITVSQFQRCLTHYFNISLTGSELYQLVNKYGDNDNFDYRLFSQSIDKSFDPNKLDGMPEKQIGSEDKKELLTLSSHETHITQQLLSKCHSYYCYRGIVVKDCYADFDRHHVGVVTLSQFHRSFPGPPDFSDDEVTLIANRYLEPNGLCNYLRFHYDICQLDIPVSATPPYPPNAAGGHVVPDQSSVQQVLAKINNAVYKNGVRSTEFFKDHDKLNSGVITENQFLCGLSLCCGQLARLSRADMQLVAEHYRSSDGRVNYRSFCNLMEHAYNVPLLEKKPTEVVQRPTRGHLLQQVNVLESEDKEARLDVVLQRLRSEVQRRQLLVYPYLQDFDRSCSQTGGVTRSQFERMINFLSLPVTVPEMELIVEKFRRPIGGDINYVAFAQAIDNQFTGHTLHIPPTHKVPESRSVIESKPLSEIVDINALLARIQEHVVVSRIRISELFKDNDPLRSGVITSSRFRQGLTLLAVHLTDEEFSELCQHYTHPSMKHHVRWKKFVEDIDQVLKLESTPTKKLTTVTLLPREGVTMWQDTASDEDKQLLQQAASKLSSQLGQRRLLARPVFQDFDRHRHGYVTSTQFQQCLSQLGISLTTDEVVALIGCFSDKEGVNYISVLQYVDPVVPQENKYQLRMTQAMLPQPDKAVASHDICPSSDQVLIKIKIKVSRQPVRVVEFFKDYDKMRSGRVSFMAFRRGIDLCHWGLLDDEVTALVNNYMTTNNMVDYQLFAEHVESVFTTTQLEKTPQQEVTQFVAPADVDMKQLTVEEDQILGGVMLRIADRVRERRIQLLPLFEDYDPVHSGCISHSQFHRVLDELQLYNVLSKQEADVLAVRFGVHKGGRHDMNYIHFCAHVDSIARSAHEQLLT